MIKPNWIKRQDEILPSREILVVYKLDYDADTPLLVFLSNPKSKLPLKRQEKIIKTRAADIEKAWRLWKTGILDLTQIKANYYDDNDLEKRRETYKDVKERITKKGKIWCIKNLITEILTGSGYGVYFVSKSQYIKGGV